MTREKQSCAHAIENFSPPACHVVFYYSSGWESWGFFPHGKSSRLTTGDSGGNVDHGKIKSGARDRNFFYACLSRRVLKFIRLGIAGLFPLRKKLPISNRRFVGHVDHGKTESRRRAIRWAPWCFGDAGNATHFGYWGGALSRNAERTLIRRLKPAASPALMERGAARTRRENRP